MVDIKMLKAGDMMMKDERNDRKKILSTYGPLYIIEKTLLMIRVIE